jgi:hypothetical protein
MRYRDVTSTTGGRFRLPDSHPYVSEVTIDPADWYRFHQLDDDNPATRILSYDEPQNGTMTVYVACASVETRRRLEDGWG